MSSFNIVKMYTGTVALPVVTDMTARVRESSLILTTNLTRNPSCSFTVIKKPGDGLDRVPVEGAMVEIQVDGLDPDGIADAIFFGFIDSVDEEVLSLRTYDEDTDVEGITMVTEYRVSCVGLESVCDRVLVAQVWADPVSPDDQLEGIEYGVNVRDIVQDIITTYLSDFGIVYDATCIELGMKIEPFVANYITASEALNKLCELTGYSWWIDPNTRKLYMKEETYMDSGFEIDEDAQTFQKIKVNRKKDQFRNVQYIRGGTELATQLTETFIGDGHAKAFTLTYDVDRKPAMITLNDVPVTYGKRGEEDDLMFTWAEGERTINQKDVLAPLSSTDILEVSYIGRFPIIVERRNEDSIDDRAELDYIGNGITMNMVQDDTIRTSKLARQRADGLLDRYSVVPTRLSIETTDLHFDQAPAIRAGQYITVDLPNHGLSGTFLIESTRMTVMSNTHIRRITIDCVDHYAQGSWIDWFRAIYKARTKGESKDSEVLLLSRAVEETLTVTDELIIVNHTSAEVEAWSTWGTDSSDSFEWGFGEWQ